MSSNVKRLSAIILISLCVMIFALPFSKSMGEICFVVILISWILKRILFRESKTLSIGLFKPVSTTLNPALYLLIFLGILSIFFTVSTALSLKGFFFKLLERIFLFFVVAETVNDRKKMEMILATIVLSLTLLSIDGIFQCMMGWDFIRHYPLRAYRMQASFSNPNGLGGWIATLLPLVLMLGVINSGYFSRKIIRYVMWGLTFTLGMCLIMTCSRGAWIGLLAALVFIGILKKRKFLIVTAIVVITLPFIIPHHIREGLLTSLPFTIPSDLQKRLFPSLILMQPIRINLWLEAIAIIKDFPMLGCGLNTYAFIAPSYKIGIEGGTYPHNSYLQMAAETGIIGLTAFLWLVFRLFSASLKNLKKIKDGFYSNVLIGLLAGMLAFLVHSFFDVNFYALQLVILMWFIMGLIIAVQRIALNEESKSGGYNV